MGHKRALIVGINYVGTGYDLRGCIKDAENMRDLISSHYGFTDIKMLLEKDATTQNIKDNLRWLVSGCRPGDTLFFHYSGHGSQILDTSGDEIDDNFDEIICPFDLNWKDKVITDDYMKWIFDTVPAGVNLTVTLDCCNSGSGLDQTHRYQPYGVRRLMEESPLEESRYLPPPPEMVELMNLKTFERKPRLVQTRDVNKTGLLISGCQAHQTSADAYIGGVWQGAATYSLLQAVSNAEYDINYKQLVNEMNDFMIESGYTQRPELNGSPLLFDTKFLAGPEVTEEQLNDYIPVDLPPVPPTEQHTTEAITTIVNEEKKKGIVEVVSVVAIFGLLLYVLSHISS